MPFECDCLLLGKRLNCNFNIPLSSSCPFVAHCCYSWSVEKGFYEKGKEAPLNNIIIHLFFVFWKEDTCRRHLVLYEVFFDTLKEVAFPFCNLNWHFLLRMFWIWSCLLWKLKWDGRCCSEFLLWLWVKINKGWCTRAEKWIRETAL